MKKKNKVSYVTLVGDNLNAGHKKILDTAKKYGKITVGLMTDEACVEYTSLPHSDYESRKTFLLKNCKQISKIIPQNTLDYSYNLDSLRPNFVIHGDDWKNGYQKKLEIK